MYGVADPHHFDADPDEEADPDPTYHFDSEPDADLVPDIYMMRIRILIFISCRCGFGSKTLYSIRRMG
jgi:hypothetical protein